MLASGPLSDIDSAQPKYAAAGVCPYSKYSVEPIDVSSPGLVAGMRRREFLGVLGGTAVAWPLAARAQQPERMRRIGMLMAAAADDPEFQARVAAFLQSLQQLGWVDGRN